jgi:hypothetical protein
MKMDVRGKDDAVFWIDLAHVGERSGANTEMNLVLPYK